MNKAKFLILICLITFVVSEDCMTPCTPGNVQCRPKDAGILDCVCCDFMDPICCRKDDKPSFMEIMHDYEDRACRLVLIKEYPELADIAYGAKISDIKGMLAVIERVGEMNSKVKEACKHSLF